MDPRGLGNYAGRVKKGIFIAKNRLQLKESIDGCSAVFSAFSEHVGFLKIILLLYSGFAGAFVSGGPCARRRLFLLVQDGFSTRRNRKIREDAYCTCTTLRPSQKKKGASITETMEGDSGVNDIKILSIKIRETV